MTAVAVIELADASDIPHYVRLARLAQEFLHSKRLAQWVPAAHSSFLPAISGKVSRHTLHKVRHGGVTLAFFDFSLEPSP